jgi:hypothetical protein
MSEGCPAKKLLWIVPKKETAVLYKIFIWAWKWCRIWGVMGGRIVDGE